MSLRPIGGIFWRPDASGNLTAYDTSGNVLGTFVGGKISAINNLSTFAFTAGPATASATGVSTGQGIAITPRISTRILVTSSVLLQVSVASKQGQWIVYRTTGSIPANNAAPTGSPINTGIFTLPLATSSYSLTSIVMDTGLTLGTAYNYYLVLLSTDGTTTVSLIGGSMQVEET